MNKEDMLHKLMQLFVLTRNNDLEYKETSEEVIELVKSRYKLMSNEVFLDLFKDYNNEDQELEMMPLDKV